MTHQMVWIILQIALTVALTACGGANEEVYNDRKIYVYTDGPTPAPRGQADANPKTIDTPPNKDAAPSVNEDEPVADDGEVIVNGSLVGALNSIAPTGRITGWAAWSDDASAIVTVRILIDGNQLAEIPANVDSFDNDTPGAHAFALDVPANLKDGKDHMVEATAMYNGEASAFTKQSFNIAAPSQSGRDFFAANLRANLQTRCGGCHPVNYDQQYASLSTPLPAAGGTALNNELINMASGRNGNVNHPGGNVCGGKNAGVCVQIQQWWGIEFGTN
jgi:cytochrome c553